MRLCSIHETPQCDTRRPFDPRLDCRQCWLGQDPGPRGQQWRALQEARIYNLPEPVAKRVTKECIHLGPIQDRLNCGCPQKWIRTCAVHARCTLNDPTAGVAVCASCANYTDDAHWPSGPVTRNLLYHVYPVAGNGAWQWNLLQLRRSIELFNGRRVVAVVTDDQTEPVSAVKDVLRGDVHEFLELPNDGNLREVLTLKPLLERVRTDDPNQVFFWAHAKGVTRPRGHMHTIDLWTRILYEANLDYWPLVENVLREHVTAGAFKKVGHGFGGSESRWHYSGSFFWARSSKLFERNWQHIDQQWWGIESYPGLHFAPVEAGCVFHEGSVGSMNMYDAEYIRKIVSPAYERWRAANLHFRHNP
jgi:hypothetical protein